MPKKHVGNQGQTKSLQTFYQIGIGAKLAGAAGASAPPLFCHPRGFLL